MELRRLGWLAVTVVLAGACGGKKGAAPPAGPAPFSIEVASDAVAIAQGGKGIVVVTVTREAGFTGDVTLLLASPPTGLAADALVLSGAQARGVFEIVVDAEVPVGRLEITLAASDGARSVTAPLGVDVEAPRPSSAQLIAEAL